MGYPKAMLFWGHIAVGVAISDATDTDLGAAIAGTLLPDIIDKTACWVIHIFPRGRFVAHGLPMFAILSSLVYATHEKHKARGFLLGYAGHLLCDLWGSGQVPWFAPFEKVAPPRRKAFLPKLLEWLPPEVAGAWYLIRRHQQKGRPRSLSQSK